MFCVIVELAFKQTSIDSGQAHHRPGSHSPSPRSPKSPSSPYFDQQYLSAHYLSELRRRSHSDSDLQKWPGDQSGHQHHHHAQGDRGIPQIVDNGESSGGVMEVTSGGTSFGHVGTTRVSVGRRRRCPPPNPIYIPKSSSSGNIGSLSNT